MTSNGTERATGAAPRAVIVAAGMSLAGNAALVGIVPTLPVIVR